MHAAPPPMHATRPVTSSAEQDDAINVSRASTTISEKLTLQSRLKTPEHHATLTKKNPTKAAHISKEYLRTRLKILSRLKAPLDTSEILSIFSQATLKLLQSYS